jgi:hypothetical protein
MSYYSVIIPFVTKGRTEWHPSEKAFSPISRGAFPTEADAHAWAKDKLGAGSSYEVREYPDYTKDKGCQP